MKLNQLIDFKDVLILEWKPGHVLYWGRSFAFASTGEEKFMDTIKIDEASI